MLLNTYTVTMATFVRQRWAAEYAVINCSRIVARNANFSSNQACFKFRENVVELHGRNADNRVRGAIIDIQRVFDDDAPAREDDVLYLPFLFIRQARLEYGVVRPR